jgi:hypothetical protein
VINEYFPSVNSANFTYSHSTVSSTFIEIKQCIEIKNVHSFMVHARPEQQAARGSHAATGKFFWPRENWLNRTQTPEKLSFKTNEV